MQLTIAEEERVRLRIVRKTLIEAAPHMDEVVSNKVLAAIDAVNNGIYWLTRAMEVTDGE